jgi:hypothetical protein
LNYIKWSISLYKWISHYISSCYLWLFTCHSFNWIMHVGYAFSINMKERWHIVDQCNFGLSISRNIEITSLLKECIIIKTFWLLSFLFGFFGFIDYHVNHWFDESIYFIQLMLIGNFIKTHLYGFQWNINTFGGIGDKLARNTSIAKAFPSSQCHQALGNHIVCSLHLYH